MNKAEIAGRGGSRPHAKDGCFRTGISFVMSLEGYMPVTTKIEFVAFNCSFDQVTLNVPSASGCYHSFVCLLFSLSLSLSRSFSLPPDHTEFSTLQIFSLPFNVVAPYRKHTVELLADRNLYFVHVRT